MKKQYLILILTFLLTVAALSACTRVVPAPALSDPPVTAPPDASKSAVPQFSYQWRAEGVTLYSENLTPFLLTPRGIFYCGSNFNCYDPNRGEITKVCGDALCDHGPQSGCPFIRYMTWMDFPVCDGEALYYIDQPIDTATGQTDEGTYVLYRSDLYGMQRKELFRSADSIEHLSLSGKKLYFEVKENEKGYRLYFFDLENGKLEAPSGEDGKGVICTLYLPVGGDVAYVSDGKLYLADARLENASPVSEEFLYTVAFSDGSALYGIKNTVGIFRIDTETGIPTQLYSVPEGRKISFVQKSQNGISFYLQEKDAREFTNNFNELVESVPENKVLLFSVPDGTVTDYDMGDFPAYYEVLICENGIFANELIKSRSGGCSTTGTGWAVLSEETGWKPVKLSNEANNQ